MTTNHTFSLHVDRLETVDQGILENVVTRAFYTVWAEDSNGNRVPYYGSVELPETNADEFVAFESLARNTVQDWVELAIGEEEMTRITDQLTVQLAQDDIVNPTVKNVAPPWMQ